MSLFITVASICLEHDYCIPPARNYLRLKTTLKTQVLMKQRGLIFIQTTRNEWQWLAEDKFGGFMEDDVLEVSLMTEDPDFFRKITIADHNPQQLYQIRLEEKEVVIDKNFTWTPATERIKQQGEFCRVTLKPEQPGKPVEKYTIRFTTPAYHWEYMLIFNDIADKRGENLILESTPPNTVTFRLPKKYGDSPQYSNAWLIVSEVPINMQEHYAMSLTLYERISGGNGKKVVSRFITTPQPGKYIATRPDTLREIVYL